MLMLMMALVLFHVAALAGVLLMSRTSVMLVDENGQPVIRNTAWMERTVAQASVPTRESAFTQL